MCNAKCSDFRRDEQPDAKRAVRRASMASDSAHNAREKTRLLQRIQRRCRSGRDQGRGPPTVQAAGWGQEAKGENETHGRPMAHVVDEQIICKGATPERRDDEEAQRWEPD